MLVLAVPDLRMLVLVVPALAAPDLRMPDLAERALAAPDLRMPDLAERALAAPDLRMPDLAEPDLQMLGLAALALAVLVLVVAGSAAQPAVLVLAVPDLRFLQRAERLLAERLLAERLLAERLLAERLLAALQAVHPSMADQYAARDKHYAAAIALTRNPIQVIAERVAPAAQRDKCVLTELVP